MLSYPSDALRKASAKGLLKGFGPAGFGLLSVLFRLPAGFVFRGPCVFAFGWDFLPGWLRMDREMRLRGRSTAITVTVTFCWTADHIGRCFHEPVAQFTDVHQPVLVNTDVHEGAEIGDVGDDSGKPHARLKVLDLRDVFIERKKFEGLPGIPAGLGQFIHDVGQGRQADGLRV
jgi:hypothetical protein